MLCKHKSHCSKFHHIAFFLLLSVSSLVYNNYLNCSLTIDGCVFSQVVSLQELAPSSADSCELILRLAKLAADIFLADLAFSLADELEEEELDEIPSSELDRGITGFW